MSSTKTAHLLLNPLIQQARFVRRLPFRYISALVFIALLATAGQILIQTLLSQQTDSGHAISLAANQETLSQRVSKDALALAVFTDATNRAFYFKEFTAVGASWNQVHLGLQHGDASLNLPANNDSIIAQDFKNLQPQYNAILKAYVDVEQFAQAYAANHPDAPYGFDTTPLVPDVVAVMNAEEPFAHGMEGIVARFEQLDANHVWTVRVAEISLFIATLMALLLEGLFIFTPALHTLKDNLRGLEKADRRWRDYTATLAQRNRQLEEAYEEAWQARSKMLLPVQQVGTGHYLVIGPARDRAYHVRRGDSGSGLVCECHAGELGYVCGHILSASHFQAARQRQAREARNGSAPQGPALGQPGGQTNAGSQDWRRSQPGVQAGARMQEWSRSQAGKRQTNDRLQAWQPGEQEQRQQTPLGSSPSGLRAQPNGRAGNDQH